MKKKKKKEREMMMKKKKKMHVRLNRRKGCVDGRQGVGFGIW